MRYIQFKTKINLNKFNQFYGPIGNKDFPYIPLSPISLFLGGIIKKITDLKQIESLKRLINSTDQ